MSMEREIEQYFVWTVQRMGGVTYKFRALNCKGVSDRIACLPGGATWFVELKAPNGRLSPLQRKFADDMRARNQNYTTLWSKTEIDEWRLSLETAATSCGAGQPKA